MNSAANQIEHPGVVELVNGNRITVRVESRSACGGCHARSQCSMTDMEEKLIETETSGEEEYRVGQVVKVCLERSLGFKALLLGYLFPFIILLVSILLMMALTGNELLSALLGIGLMFPYYAWLYFKRNMLRSRFHFRIKAY